MYRVRACIELEHLLHGIFISYFEDASSAQLVLLPPDYT